MGKRSKPREGSLQFWPRKKAEKFLPSVNWDAIETAKKGMLGLIAYKVGMASAFVKDNTPDSLTKDKKIAIPVTILEIPLMRVFSVRFYKDNKVVDELFVENLDKELKKIIKMPKKKARTFEEVKDYDDVRLMIYTRAKDTGIKKTPDMTEIALSGSLDEKKTQAKEKLGKDIHDSEIFKDTKLIDIRGLTKGKGTQGPVKRFNMGLKMHKTEKGVRRPGSLGPWHPAHVIFRVPMMGQVGMFTRVHYNQPVIKIGKISEKNINPAGGWYNYGNIETEYMIVGGSVQGPSKRQVLITLPLRPTKHQAKKHYDFLELM